MDDDGDLWEILSEVFIGICKPETTRGYFLNREFKRAWKGFGGFLADFRELSP